MLGWLPHWELNEPNIAIAMFFAAVVLYETKTKEPITFFFGDPKLFEGTKKKRILKWILFIFIVSNLLLKY